MKTNPNDSAFNGPSEYEAERGLTKLEHFAASVASGISANHGFAESTEEQLKRLGVELDMSTAIAKFSVLTAHALIAELNKQAESASEQPDADDLAAKAAFERRMTAHSLNVPCEEKDCALCKKRAAEILSSPQFEVGDAVLFEDVPRKVHKLDKSGIIVLDNGAWVTADDLTLISKEVKP